MESDWSGRWNHVRKFVERGGPFAHPDFEPSTEVSSVIEDHTINDKITKFKCTCTSLHVYQQK